MSRTWRCTSAPTSTCRRHLPSHVPRTVPRKGGVSGGGGRNGPRFWHSQASGDAMPPGACHHQVPAQQHALSAEQPRAVSSRRKAQCARHSNHMMIFTYKMASLWLHTSSRVCATQLRCRLSFCISCRWPLAHHGSCLCGSPVTLPTSCTSICKGESHFGRQCACHRRHGRVNSGALLLHGSYTTRIQTSSGRASLSLSKFS